MMTLMAILVNGKEKSSELSTLSRWDEISFLYA